MLIEIRTVLLLLWIGNLAVVTLMASYIFTVHPRYPFFIFLIARFLQMSAWILLWLRGSIPDIYSEFIGNTLLFAGWAIEAFALFDIHPTKRTVVIFCMAATLTSVALNYFFIQLTSSNLKIFAASIVPLVIFVVPGFSLGFKKNASLLQRVSGALYLLFLIATAFRALTALFARGPFSLMTSDLSQTGAFLAIFWLMLFGSITFLLQSKEKTDQELVIRAGQIATLEERARISRDLHDRVSQNLFSLSIFGASSIKHLEAGEKLETFDDLQTIEYLTQQTQAEMRLLLYELTHGYIDKTTLGDLLNQRFRIVESHLNIKTSLEMTGCEDVTQEVKETLYAIMIETLNNVIKHASAKTVAVQLQQEGRIFHLQIQDDGRGFNTEESHPSRGMGLENMRTRAQLANGQLNIFSHPGKGTLVEALIPDHQNGRGSKQ